MSLSVLHYSGLSLISLLDSLSGSYSTVNQSSFPETETVCQSVLSIISTPCSEPVHNIFNIFSKGGCRWPAHIAILHGCQSQGTINTKLDFKTLISYQ